MEVSSEEKQLDHYHSVWYSIHHVQIYPLVDVKTILKYIFQVVGVDTGHSERNTSTDTT